MRVVYKYEIEIGSTRLELPKGYVIRKVGVQTDIICLWVDVDPNEDIEVVWFWTNGTGRELPTDAAYQYLDTVFNSPYVWHVYLEIS